MKNILLLLFIGIFSLSACKNKSVPTEVVDGMAYFGEKITAEGAMTYDELLTKLESVDSLNNIKVIG